MDKLFLHTTIGDTEAIVQGHIAYSNPADKELCFGVCINHVDPFRVRCVFIHYYPTVQELKKKNSVNIPSAVDNCMFAIQLGPSAQQYPFLWTNEEAFRRSTLLM
jgi:hypothetical protein